MLHNTLSLHIWITHSMTQSNVSECSKKQKKQGTK